MDESQRELPKYVSHKTVWALKIKEIRMPDTGGDEWDGRYELVPADAGYGPFLLEHDYWAKHQPKAGGYYVVYADGYKSFSPAQAFEEGCTRTDQ